MDRLADSGGYAAGDGSAREARWHEWGQEAFARARRENKLILLNIGYPACRWQALMEMACFSSPRFAMAADSGFILIKVDREIYPAIDFLYMAAAIAIRKSGGWPNNMFLTPDLDPVVSVGFAGWEDMVRLMGELTELWKKSEKEIRAHAAHISHVIRIHLEIADKSNVLIEPDMAKLRVGMDMINGGFTTESKFPMTGALEFLFNEGSDDGFVKLTLDRMARGAMFDHVNGGFFRCAVDSGWEKPQFEKTLCDSALLASLYARAALGFGNEEYEYTARKTLDFMAREFFDKAAGAFGSSIGDDGAEEGERYTWSYDEAYKLTGDQNFLRHYAIRKEGNITRLGVSEKGGPKMVPTGKNALRRLGPGFDQANVEKLRQARGGPLGPMDKKTISAWQGMAISAFARAGVIFDNESYMDVARLAGRFAVEKLGKAHYWLDGRPMGQANLEDGAYLAMGFWDLFEATGADEWLAECRKMVDYSKEKFSAPGGGYYMAEPMEGMIARPRNFEDQPYPSAAALLARVDWRLSFALGQAERATATARTAESLMASLKGGGLLGGEAMSLSREVLSAPMEVLYSLPDGGSHMRLWIKSGYARRWGVIRIPLGGALVNPALSFGRGANGTARAFVCHDGFCHPPAESAGGLRSLLRELSGG